MIPDTKKSILKRRNRFTNTVQAGIDGLAIIAVAWSLVWYRMGSISPEYATMLLLLLGILAVVFDRYAVYRQNVSFTFQAITLAKAWTVSFSILVLIGFLSKQGEYYSRLLVAQIFVIGLSVQLFLQLIFYYLQKSWLKYGAEQENALIIGHGDLANYLSMKINQNPWMGQNVVGALTVDDAISEDRFEFEHDGLRVLGDVGQLPELIEKYQVSTVYIVTPLQNSTLLEDVYFTLLDGHIAVHWIPDIFSLRLVNHSVNEIAGIPVLTLSETPLTGTHLVAKALEDRVISFFILLFISPLLLLVASAIKLDSSGPVFFRQKRTGWNGETFRIWKFRSMYVHSPEDGTVDQAKRNDSRITRVGKVLRRTSLDELPQLLNVLIGDMSLVGPRPHAVEHDQEYSQRITDYFARHQIKPGMTGLAQVRGFRGETRDINQMVQRVESDIEYINNWSLWLDFTILLRTVLALTGKSAY